ncbi:aspartate carbamoyltransferase catalytic subunit [Desulfurispirillum indicum]|uniref:Aspartate carbamoyltransferase n=1 Tax=Desulfurispirillum indicum (strain ATCC BAA-1389 / DSM 22839 / S5) TaxID=653733 RepID=E6W0F5_DESIS|nr:aspartate carbamoyltransferase catalytic subunit [Desulfurispirillum indicum]ADU66373.1 aspartate carbamoyltransferase [Desulfurispirillum indicum S5]UCZ55706.1 aspartate carbamoyltransferase catalytic subunit [Desulfurispirillum indicum]
MEFKQNHILGLYHLSAEEITLLLDTAREFKGINTRAVKKVPPLKGKTQINMFFENSTRTRTSFEIAGKRLSADTINFSSSTSSTTKGETLLDTARNIMAMHPDVIVIRHSVSGSPKLLADNIEASVINAGDGAHEHPSQALLDIFTIQEHIGKLAGVNVLIVGDVAHSRVVRSNIIGLHKLGANVRLCAPRTMMPRNFHIDNVPITSNFEEVLPWADVVIMLRIQMERQHGPALFPNTAEYSRIWGLNKRRQQMMRKDAVILHPGPVNRGLELSPEVADGERSLILQQVENGVAVRMSMLFHVLHVG